MSVEAVLTSSYADVMWQDGNVETGIPSTELYPIHHLDDHEFFPGDFVIHSGPPHLECVPVDPHKYGVIQIVDHAARTAQVGNCFYFAVLKQRTTK